MRRMAVLVALLALSGVAPTTVHAAPSLANRCVALGVAGGGYVALSGADGYARTGRRGAAAAFFLEPAGLRSYLLHDRRGVLLTPAGTGTREPGPRAEWTRAALTRRYALARARRCRAFPEARVGASGRPHRRTHRDGSIFGFADLHLHITAELRAGGRVIHGKSFDRYGVSRALGGDERDHGADGSADIVGNLLRTGMPDATHDTAGLAGVHRLAGARHLHPPPDLLPMARAHVEGRPAAGRGTDGGGRAALPPRPAPIALVRRDGDRGAAGPAAASVAEPRGRAERRAAVAAGSGWSTARGRPGGSCGAASSRW